MICFGHRGAMGHILENTLESFELAIKQGVNSIELDVISVENTAVVYHDLTLERLCNTKKSLQAMSLNEISKIRINNKFKIPLLSEVFDLVSNKVGINIELKSSDSANAVLKAIQKKNYDTDDLLISSFNHKELLTAKALIPNVKIGALQISIPKDNAKFAEDLAAYSVHPALEFIDQDYINDAHQRGLKVFVFTVNDSEDFVRLNQMGVDGVFTNYPDLFFKTLTRANTKF